MSKINTLIKEELALSTDYGKYIYGDITKFDQIDSKGIVIFAHGFKGFKDWGHFNLIADKFALSGLPFVKFNFSHNGTNKENPTDFVDLEAFGNNNFSKEMNDLGIVIDWVEEYLKSYKENIPVYLIGHSRGGGIAILKAFEDSRINKLVTWSAVSDFEARFPEDLERFKKEGVVYIPNARTNQNMPLYYSFVEDYYQNQKRLHIPGIIEKISIPYFIIHGTDDEAVSSQEADYLHKLCKTSKLLLVKNAGHTFGGKHPWTEDSLPKDSDWIVKRSIEFFLEISNLDV